MLSDHRIERGLIPTRPPPFETLLQLTLRCRNYSGGLVLVRNFRRPVDTVESISTTVRAYLLLGLEASATTLALV